MSAATNRRQRGSSLIILMGIVATVIIMSTALVTLIGNMQTNTADQRLRDKAAGAGEAAVDAMMYEMSLTWPSGPSPSPCPTFSAATVESQFRSTSPSEFPLPASGSFVSAIYYDNSDTTGDGRVNRLDAAYDANHDNMLFVEGQGNVGDRSVRVQVLVQRTFVDTTFPRGVAVYTGGDLSSNGGGNNPKIHVEDLGSLTAVTGYVKGTLDTTSVFQSTITPIVGAACPPLASVLSDALINQVVALAKNRGTYYDVAGGASMPSDFSDLKVIRVNDGTTVGLGNATINSLASPGVLFVLGGNAVNVDMAGNGQFWGVLYTEGTFRSSHGTPDIHGMVICKSDLDMRGTADIWYNDTAIVRLQDRWTLAVKLVPNTWREISPGPAP